MDADVVRNSDLNVQKPKFAKSQSPALNEFNEKLLTRITTIACRKTSANFNYQESYLKIQGKCSRGDIPKDVFYNMKMLFC